ncbi:aspartyl-phosphate phosphatase Spo0E family protein, partial [Bacillus mycoides]|uniref:aspartyl-phosphate phosphatase Spo0E family protein n=3 Tax=Bacillaceae TaxID=186817 RepID=UPI001E4E372B
IYNRIWKILHCNNKDFYYTRAGSSSFYFAQGECERKKFMLVAKLNDLIENKKLELVELVNKHGFSHKKVLYLSQEIDKLINKYMIIKKEPYNSRVQREQIHKINKENNLII